MKSLIVIACIFLYSCNNVNPEPTRPPATLEAKHCHKYVLNEQNVYREIMANGIMFSDIVLRQAILETGHFTSHNCLERNNLFGMTGGEKTSDNIHGYAIYSTWMESVYAYKLWQSKRMDDSVTDYFQFLRDWNYAESEEYERKLRSIKLVIVKQ